MTLTGTLPYMAPEQFDGISDQRTDLWAAGVVLYELATGQLPFPETQLQRLKDAIKREDPIRPTAINPAISPGLECVILRALQKDPKRRYQTATELHDDLRESRGTQSQNRRRADGEEASPLRCWRWRWRVPALIAYHFWPEIQEKLGRQPPAAVVSACWRCCPSKPAARMRRRMRWCGASPRPSAPASRRAPMDTLCS